MSRYAARPYYRDTSSEMGETDMAEHYMLFVPCAKRVRGIVDGETVVDSLSPGLLIESGKRPVYYFPRADVRTDRLERSAYRARCPYKGDETYWTLNVGDRRGENAVWSYESPPSELDAMKGHLAFAAGAVDHWLEEDEEVFGHPCDPFHRVDVRPSTRRVWVVFAGETVADTTRALFLFETGHPTRHYVPPADVRTDLLEATQRKTVCPYKGSASYWTLRVGDRTAPDAVWGYLDPVPECPRIKGYFCFYPEKVEAIEVASGG